MPCAPGLRALWLCAALCAFPCAPQPGPASAACPAPCHCQEDGVMLSADCSELGLSAVPRDLAPLTAFLDLSMNNLTELQPGRFQHLRFLEELRLSGNHLSHIPGGAFSGLHSLKTLMLQNNRLGGVPTEALWQLPSLQSLRLDANLISRVPDRSFEGLSRLRHLWLDDNALAEVPVRALNNLPALQAMTLALNRISHVPDYAFQSLSSLVVLHLHNNRIQRLGTHSFEGLHSLETLDLNHNELRQFPVAIRTLGRLQELGFHNNSIRAIPERAFVGNPLLQAIHFYDNPIQSVGRSAFQDLPKLHTLSLNGATDIQEFPDLKGTTSLEALTLTRAGVRLLPPGMCQQLPRLRILELSHNRIEELPSLHRCQKLEEIGLQHNRIWEVGADTFRQLSSLRALDLSWNAIRSIHPEAFATLHSLVKLDLRDNQLTTLPLAGLGGLVHLRLKGNPALSQAFSKDSFPKLRILEAPHAYQCCVYGGLCTGFFKAPRPWEADDFHPEDEEAPRSPLGLLAGQAESHYDLDLDELQLQTEDRRPQPSVQCSPVPGPFKPCEHLFESWGVRLAVWAVSVLSLLGNGLVLLSVFAAGPGPLPPVKFVVGAIAGANTVTGISCGLLASVDALTFGRFAEYGAHWESGPGCRATGFLAVLGSEASALLLTLAAVQCGVSASCARARRKAPALGSVRAGALGCLALAGLAAALPLASVGDYGASPLCLPYTLPEGRPAALGFAVALVMLHSCCFLVAACAHIRLYCELPRGEPGTAWDGALARHVAWLILADGLLHCPVAFLSVASMLGLVPIAPEAVKSVLLLVLPLPACLNPLLYLLSNPRFREDLGRLWPWAGAARPLVSAAAGHLQKSSCDSTQALVAFSDVDLILEASEAGRSPGPETYGFPAVALVSQGGTRLEGSCFVEPEGTHFGNQQPSMDRELLLRAEGAVPGGGRSSAGRGVQRSGSVFASHV